MQSKLLPVEDFVTLLNQENVGNNIVSPNLFSMRGATNNILHSFLAPNLDGKRQIRTDRLTQPQTLHKALETVHPSSDCLIQYGVSAVQFIGENEAVVGQYDSRVSKDSFQYTQEEADMQIAFIQQTGVGVVSHYIQNLIPIDLDLRAKKFEGDLKPSKFPVSKLNEDPLNIDGKATDISIYLLRQLENGSNPKVNKIIEEHLYAWFLTQNGVRFIFCTQPLEVFSCPPEARLSGKIVKTSPKNLEMFYEGLSKMLSTCFPSELKTVSGKTVSFDWDIGTTKTNFAISRLPKVQKPKDREENIYSCDLTSTEVEYNEEAKVFQLFSEDNKPTQLFLDIVKFAEKPQAATVPAQQHKPASIFQAVANTPDKDKFYPANNFKSEEEKMEFARELVQNFMKHPLLSLCTKENLGYLPYQAWISILSNFRTLHTWLGFWGLSEGQKYVELQAINWSKNCEGFLEGETEYQITTLLNDGHEENSSAKKIIMELGEKFYQSLNQEKKALLDTFPLDRPISSHAYSLTNESFKKEKKYSPTTGKVVLVEKGKPVFDENGELVTFATLTQELVERIVETDKLLPQVIRFDIVRSQIIVAPNIGKVLSAALKDQYEEPIKDFLLWTPITEATASSLRLYLKQTYKVKKEITFLNLADNLFPRISDPSRDVEHFQCNVLFTELQKRHIEFKTAKSQNISILGTTKYLEEWLPRILHIDPKKSAEHRALAEMYGAYGRSYLLGLVQRCALGHDQEIKYEQMLFVRGKSGSGKTELAKQIVSGIFGKTALTSWAGAGNFIAEMDGVPKDKDDIAQLFGKVLCLFDDISSDVLKKTEQGHLKAFLSSTRDSIRLPYARTSVSVNRSCTVFATSNSRFLLNDTTSSRRMFIVDLDQVSNTGNFICDLLDKDSMQSLERSASQTEENEGYIDLKNASHIIALACGEAFAKGVLGEDVNKQHTMSVFPLEGTLGRSDKSRSILVENNRLTTKEQQISDDQVQQFQIGNLSIQDNKQVFSTFLQAETGIGSDRTSFELHELKEHFKINGVQQISDNSIKLWADTPKEGADGKMYKIVSQRKRIKGERVTLWQIWNITDNCEAKQNPFVRKTHISIETPKQTALKNVANAKTFRIQ